MKRKKDSESYTSFDDVIKTKKKKVVNVVAVDTTRDATELKGNKKKLKAKDKDSEKCATNNDAIEMKKKKIANVDGHETLRDSKQTNGKKKKMRKCKEKVSELFSPIEANETGEEKREAVEEGEDNLSPEERRVLERKLKKILRKEEKKRQREGKKNEETKTTTSVAQTQALEYLTCWSEKRDEWKFQKTRQVWLLQHMYDTEKVSDVHFSVILSYLEGLQGTSRETTLQRAEVMVRWDNGQESTDSEHLKKMHRAKEVIQILS